MKNQHDITVFRKKTMLTLSENKHVSAISTFILTSLSTLLASESERFVDNTMA